MVEKLIETTSKDTWNKLEEAATKIHARLTSAGKIGVVLEARENHTLNRGIWVATDVQRRAEASGREGAKVVPAVIAFSPVFEIKGSPRFHVSSQTNGGCTEMDHSDFEAIPRGFILRVYDTQKDFYDDALWQVEGT
jgi:hypothetical protein